MRIEHFDSASGSIWVVESKTGKSKSHPLRESTCVAISECIAARHLKPLAGFSALMFPWPYGRRTLWVEFHRIEAAAKVKPDGKAHYGFHDFRRAFATMNAASMTADALQALMRHKSYTTTQKYIAMSQQMNPAVAALFVPELTAPRAPRNVG